jgi:hypothetical protein
LLLVVFVIGFLSNVLANYFGTEFIAANIVLVLVISVAALTLASYELVLTPSSIHEVIYANISIDHRANSIMAPVGAPAAAYWAEGLFKYLRTDNPALAEKLLSSMSRFNERQLPLDFFEYLVFLAIWNFDFLWGSPRAKAHGHPLMESERERGQIAKYYPSALFIMKRREHDDPTQNVFDISNAVRENVIIQQFSKKTSVGRPHGLENWGFVGPPSIRFNVNREKGERVTRILEISDRFVKMSIEFYMHGTGIGLPRYVKGYDLSDERQYSTKDFRIDFDVSFNRLLSVLPRMDRYLNWTERTLQDLVTAFTTSQR